MGFQYSHLDPAERVYIESALSKGISQSEIALKLGRSRSTICREIQRASTAVPGWYLAIKGQQAHDSNRRAAGLARRKLGSDTSTPAWQHVILGLSAGLSPQQIAHRAKRSDILAGILPAAPHRVSHDTIYCAIYAQPRGALRTQLISWLARSHNGRRPRSRSSPRRGGHLQDITSIALRPSQVADRTVPGHWEGDFLKGANNRSAIGTLVERTSRYTILARMDGTTPTDALHGFTRRMRRIPAPLRQSLTYDQGFEMARHKELAKRLKIDIYFCDPYKPSQRGTNENTNGLLRRYLPKGLDLSAFTDQDLAKLEFILNNRPRRILGYRTPQEVFDELCHQTQH